MSKDRTSPNLQNLAESLIDFALSHGADEAEVSIQEGSEFNVDVRLGEIESLLEAGSKHLSFRLIKDKKTASAGSSDLSRETLNGLILSALKRIVHTHPDEYSGLPETQKVSIDPDPLRLYDPVIQELRAKEKIDLALQTERTALSDPRITNSHGAGFATRDIKTIIANSKGFSGTSSDTFFSLGLGLQAGKSDQIVEGYWSTTNRFFAELENTDDIARKAIERTVRQLNPRKIATRKIPVIFEPNMTAWLMGFLFGCVSGTAVYQKTTFLAGSLGETIGNSQINVIDDALMPGRLGTSPFDSEGVPSQSTEVIREGRLQNFLLNTYTARKLGKKTTGNAAGSGIGPGNFYLKAGDKNPHEILKSMDEGMILIRTIGHGLNPVTGDISRGAFGLWVENGEILYPVSEVTISGNLGAILHDIELVGNDLEFRSSVCGPTIKIAEMTVAGQ